jgi:hypothetical protein
MLATLSFARSVVAVVDFFTRQARAGSRHDGLSELGQNRDADPDPVPLGHLVPGTLVDSPTSVDEVPGDPGAQEEASHSQIPRSRSPCSSK